jgi:rhodanese-related sulfurtransferase
MKTISKDELAAKLGTPGVVLVNVLAPEAYDKIHIKGSISIPRNELEGGRWKELDKSNEIITHCSSYTCDASRNTAVFLEKQGYNVRAYEGGLREWAEAKLPTEGKISAEQWLTEKYGTPQSTPMPAS